MTDRDAHRAAVEAGYASLAEYIKKWGDDKMNVEPILEEVKKWKGTAAVALFNVEKLKDEIERLREALQELLNVTPNFPPEGNLLVGMEERYNKALIEARSALQQKESE